MRKIEQQMVAALNQGRDWKSGNTTVNKGGQVFLYGNKIAFREEGVMRRDEATFRRWPTATTKSRLRALGLPTGDAR